MAKPSTGELSPHNARIAAAIDSHGGNGMGERIVLEARGKKIPIGVLCAIVEQESNFSNVFGHDRTQNGNPSGIPEKWMGKRVTRYRYWRYKRRRNAGMGCQGVGPCQLTFYTIQDEADRDGGCRHIKVNIATAAEYLHNLHMTSKTWYNAFQLWNAGHLGTGQGKEYADSVSTKRHAWRQIISNVK